MSHENDRRSFEQLAIINDYVRVPYANGSSYASQFLYRELSARGHAVTVVGPEDPEAKKSELPPRHVSLPSIPLRNHPGVNLAMPTRKGLAALRKASFDLVLAQASSALLDAGVWLRQRYGVPLVCVNTLHMPSVYNVILPNWLHQVAPVRWLFAQKVIPWVERSMADMYNAGDGLIVLSPGLKKYWEERGVEVPIHVIPRAIERRVFDRTDLPDPFPANAKPGKRVLVVCRHTREKSIDRLLRIFAEHLLPRVEDISITLVGDGPDHDGLRELADQLGIGEQTHFVGEKALAEMSGWYRHADLFVYASLSETYGQVVSEALWCGLPVVAFDDGMGVAGQVSHREDGFLIDPIHPDADLWFARCVELVLGSPALRGRLASSAVDLARARSEPSACVTRYMEVFEVAKDHANRASREASWRTNRRLVRWVTAHLVAAALGLVRRPVQLNRNEAPTGTWTLPPSTNTAGTEIAARA